jgi:hypothetical protein
MRAALIAFDATCARANDFFEPEIASRTKCRGSIYTFVHYISALRVRQVARYLLLLRSAAGSVTITAMTSSRTPLIVALLLAIPLLYAGSYLALVRRDGIIHDPPKQFPDGMIAPSYNLKFYRLNWDFLATVYWPLEQVDRRLVPGWWLDMESWYQRIISAPPAFDPSA